VKTLLVALFALFLASPVLAQQDWTLTTPEDVGLPDRTTWRVRELRLKFESGAGQDENQVFVYLTDNNGNDRTCSYSGDNTSTAHSDIVALNKINLTVTSLHARILTALASKGGTDDTDPDGGACLAAGSVTGSVP